MSTASLKQLLAAAMAVMAIVGFAVVMSRLGRIVEETGTGADPAAVLTVASAPERSGWVLWDRDGAPLVRPMDPATREAVAAAYLQALSLFDEGVPAEETDAVVHLTGPALVARRDVTPRGGVLARHHQLRALFHSADGRLVEVEDVAESVVRLDGLLVIRSVTATATLIEVDGTWRLRHRTVTSSTTESVVDDRNTDRVVALRSVGAALFSRLWWAGPLLAAPAIGALVRIRRKANDTRKETTT